MSTDNQLFSPAAGPPFSPALKKNVILHLPTVSDLLPRAHYFNWPCIESRDNSLVQTGLLDRSAILVCVKGFLLRARNHARIVTRSPPLQRNWETGRLFLHPTSGSQQCVL